jgi:hypothetical protein
MRIHSLDATAYLCHGIFDSPNDAKMARCMSQAAKVLKSVTDAIKCSGLQTGIRLEVGIRQLYKA